MRGPVPSAVALSWRLLRTGGRRDAATALLAVTGLAVTTALLVLTVGTWSGLHARTDRTAWRTPQTASSSAVRSPATTGAPVVQRTTTSAVGGRALVVVDLAATGSGAPPVPPGLAVFPAPGQALLSPALADLVRRHPGGPLGARFGHVTGVVGRAGLAFPQELVAVVGHRPDDATMTAPAWRDQRRPEAFAGPAPVTGFATGGPPGVRDGQYRALAQVAFALLVVPVGVLGGAATRLGLARRDRRLAAVRLAGASPAQVLVMTAVESGLTTAAGALAGVVGALALTPLAARVPVDGGSWYAADLVPPAGAVVGVLLGVLVLGVGSAVVALRRVLSAPLGVAASHTPRPMSPVRLAVFAVLLLTFLRASRSDDASVTALVLVLAAVFTALAVVGPWVVGLLGRAVVARSRSAAGLLAGRRLVDDPRGAWRVVGAVTMTGFVAGVLALFPAGSSQPLWGSPARLDLAVPAAGAAATAAELRTQLAAAGVPADVRGPDADPGALLTLRAVGQDVQHLSVDVHDPGRDLEAARSVAQRVAPSGVAATGSDVTIDDDQYLADFRTGSVLVLGASFLVATASAGITGAASVLDRRRTLRQLALLGVPLRVLDRARALETLLPLALLSVGSALTGVVVASPLTRLGLGGGGAGLDASGALRLAASLALGVGAVALASAASRPLLARVSADPTSAAD